MKLINIVSGKEIFLLGMISIFLSIFYFWGINWGTPNWKKTLQIFETKEELEKYVSRMIELRDRYYTERQKFIEGKYPNTIETYKKIYGNPNCGYFEKLPEDTILSCVRNYVIGILSSDEQHTLMGIRNMNIKKLDFNPDHYIYGGLYFYIVSVLLILAKVVGFVTFNTNLTYYFFNPEEINHLYIVQRLLGPLSAIFSIVVIYFILKNLVSKKILIISLLIIGLNYYFVYYAHLVKPHLLGTLFVTLGIYYCYKIFQDDSKKYYFYAGLFFGVASSIIYSNLIFFSSVFLIALIQYKKCKIAKLLLERICIFFVPFFIAIILTNYFLITNYSKLINIGILQGSVVWDNNYISFRKGLDFLYKTFSIGYLWLILPGGIIGIVISLKIKEKFMRFLILLFFYYLLISVFYVRHPGLVPVLLVLLLVFFSIFLDTIVSDRMSFLRVLGKLYVIIVLLIFLFNSIFMLSLYVRKGNLTLAGKWINQNVPKYTSIGVPGGWFASDNFPPFEFLKYNLINIPPDFEIGDDNKLLLPEYLIILEDRKKFFQKSNMAKYYKEIYSLTRKFLGIKFDKGLVVTENQEIIIYKLY